MNKINPKHTQNFITSSKYVNKLLNCTNIDSKDKVLEIGSGKGHFTKELLKRSEYVKAIEIDPYLVQSTLSLSEHYSNLEVIQKDILEFSFPNNRNYKIFGNIPFNISTPIVKKIVFESQVEHSYLIVERGFAKRLQNLQRAFGLLVMVEVDIHILQKVPRSYFHPQPKVDSVLIAFKRHEPLIDRKDYKNYKSFVYKWVNKEYRTLFTKNQLRKTMKFAQVTDLNNITKSQFISIYNSYKLFN